MSIKMDVGRSPDAFLEAGVELDSIRDTRVDGDATTLAGENRVFLEDDAGRSHFSAATTDQESNKMLAGGASSETESEMRIMPAYSSGLNCPPVKIRNCYLVFGGAPYGKSFPDICFVGPDWKLMLVTYTLMIVPTIWFMFRLL